MKPAAPSEYRGPLRPIRTNVAGIEICEYFPRLAQRADRFSLIRSLHHEMSAHNDGSIEVLTGKTPRAPDPTSQAHSEHPDFGMVAARLARSAYGWRAAICRRAARAVHDQPGLPGRRASGLRHGRSVPAGLFAAQSDARDGGRQPPARRSAIAHRTVRSLSPRRRCRRDDGGHRSFPGRRVSVAHEPPCRHCVRPEPRVGGKPRAVRPASLGTKLPVGPSPGRGGGRRHQHRRHRHVRLEQEFQLGRPRRSFPPRLRTARTPAPDGPGALGLARRPRRAARSTNGLWCSPAANSGARRA